MCTLYRYPRVGLQFFNKNFLVIRIGNLIEQIKKPGDAVGGYQTNWD